MARNVEFWIHYTEDLRMKYIFFVQDGDVRMIRFTDFLEMTKVYSERVAGKTSKAPLKECRRIADDLISAHLKGRISN